MTGPAPLAEALARYEAALERAADLEKAARDERDAAIRAVHAAGKRQVDIIKETGYSRETVRQILNPEERDKVRERRSGSAPKG